MTNEARESALPGVTYERLTRHADPRGSFAEAWRNSPGTPFPGVQANLSSSQAGVLRGLHMHLHQADRWIILAGRAFVVLVDVRPLLDDPSTMPGVETALLARDDVVTIPIGVAHGFLALDPLELLYVVTNEYDGTDELGFFWNDPSVGIDWPVVPTPDGRPVLSERDRTNPTLAALVASIRQAGAYLG